ncbi:MAG: hypothetical protein ACR2P3_05225 [Geminicoccaceae bacterium]
MSTDADELARAIGGVKLRQIGMVVITCCATIAAIGAAVAGWQKLGGPVPATREFVLEHVSKIADSQAELASFAKSTRALLLQLQYGEALETIVLLEEKIAEGKGGRDTRMLLQAKRQEAEKLKRQLDSLDQINQLQRVP